MSPKLLSEKMESPRHQGCIIILSLNPEHYKGVGSPNSQMQRWREGLRNPTAPGGHFTSLHPSPRQLCSTGDSSNAPRERGAVSPDCYPPSPHSFRDWEGEPVSREEAIFMDRHWFQKCQGQSQNQEKMTIGGQAQGLGSQAARQVIS